MTIKKLSFTVLLFFFIFKITAQTKQINQAHKKYEDYAYADAIIAYKSVIKKDTINEEIIQRLGNSYYFTGDLRNALKQYDHLFAINKNQESEYLYRYAQCLKSLGNYNKADQVLDIFNKKETSQNRAALIRKEKNYLSDIKYNSGRFEIADAGVNSAFSDYGGTVYDNKLVFTSARDTGGIYKSHFKWTNKSFSKLYTAELMPDGSIGKLRLFRKNDNAKFNESSPIFTKDGRTMYFTRNNFTDGKRGENDKKVTLLKLYKAELINGEWENIKELPFNSNQYSTAHPALSVDEKTLYFASDMPGSYGQSDLYKVTINTDGSFGTPENLGLDINTEGKETFPFVSGDNEMYFSSDGRPGLGGLDVYVAKINEKGGFDEIQNVGYPINSKHDDFAFTIDSRNRNGFFSSDRENAHGLDDIYRFTETKKLICEQDLKGTVNDSESNEIIANASLILLDEDFNTIQDIVSDEKGSFLFPKVICGKKYSIRISKTDYNKKDVAVVIKRESGDTALTILLQKIFKPMETKSVAVTKAAVVKPVKVGAIKVGTDLAKLLNIPMNFFDLGKATIKKTSEPDLQKLVDALNQYPTLKLDIRSHTDSRSSAESNQILSDKRAQSTKEWLVSKGIAESRLTAKGYGETKLVNKCADGVKCTEKEHQQNRRSEFIIVSM
ncbi:WD40 repeat protein [Flavobacterium cutihirudinis]|uniref:WD40 repeat protein n=1 Tax=Flavobacterium cutihirudinis TaxID=1265740 RepID=A0A3D9FNC0_9FLAO|nr:OmpA family protein [Flavobacterium cutihirudinis]RED21906.1 WD40 repeat protein [Flavobacterium cutihirudinis]